MTTKQRKRRTRYEHLRFLIRPPCCDVSWLTDLITIPDCFYYDVDLITDEDFIILSEFFSSRNPDFAYDLCDRFDFDNMNDDECKAEFRVRKRDPPTLAQALRIPRSFQLSLCHVRDYIYRTHNHLITQWNHTLLSPRALEVYAETIHGKVAALENSFGSVDGTVQPIARPDEQQRIMYSGHKRVHAFKFQSLGLPNGLIGNLYGPVGK